MSLTHMANEMISLPDGTQAVARFTFSRQVVYVPQHLDIPVGSRIYANHGREYEVLSVGGSDLGGAQRLDLRIVRVVMP
ncbi:hypothetical protein [Microbacterium sp. No. 7]|uniref:hypothetical protein n=1 Tax=Microbacterium sp. No. 7 TaxID=1714373 RepID=UPI0006CF6A24|nr:hypothetical protein [Microbacterium sp. No. 7]ALJ19544.1 hypothetical protein AOA12_06325 [Microbacterium sp. No. 7]